MKKIGFIFILLVVSLNASLYSLITGVNISEDEYESKLRGVVISQDINADGIADSQNKILKEDLNKKINIKKDKN